jgi:hypothetical protein
MSQSISITPTTDDPEPVWVAYRAMIQAGGLERMALQSLADAVRHRASYAVMRAAEEELAYAERRRHSAFQAYLAALRGTRSVPDPEGTTDGDPTHGDGMQCYDMDATA